MLPGTFNLAIYRGDSYAWQFQLWQDEDKTEPVDLTDATVKAEVRARPCTPVLATADLVVTLPNIIGMSLTAEMTAALANGEWDLQITFPDGTVRTVVRGSVKITADVTDCMVTTTLMARQLVRR